MKFGHIPVITGQKNAGKYYLIEIELTNFLYNS